MKQLNLQLLELTKPYIGRADQVQGPGGNTSAKGEHGEMMIKASGFRFEEINTEKGFSTVNYRIISSYFNHVMISDKEKEEKQSVQFILDNILKDEDGNVYPKPSMETGFHAVLDKYVIHTHSVWSNLINCNTDAENLLNRIRKETGITISFIPYVSPGFGLSYLIANVMKDAESGNGKFPKVFFLANHGIIAHSDNIEEAQGLLSQIDQAIINLFSGVDHFPETGLRQEAETYMPEDGFVNEKINFYQADLQFFDQVLFPDQTVFFKDNISFDQVSSDKKIRINNGKMSYHAGYREAKSIHETMTAYLFIYDAIKKSGQDLQFIPAVELDYINGMDMEKHRKSLM